MQQISIANVPNQELSFNVNNTVFNVILRATSGVMSATIVINNVEILSNSRTEPNALIIPYGYLENGNLYISTLNEELPDYTKFGVSQFLIYVFPEELIAARDT